MSKGLTEQWKNGELEGGHYYLLMKDGSTRIANTVYVVGEKQFYWENTSIDFVQEVLAPVPSYEEYQDIIQQNVNQESAIETYIERIKELEKKVHILNEANMKLENELGNFADLSKKVERLQEQIKEANECIKDKYLWTCSACSLLGSCMSCVHKSSS